MTFLGHFLYPWKMVPMNIKFFHINKILFILILIRNLNVKMQGIYRYMINEQNYLRSLTANHYFNVFLSDPAKLAKTSQGPYLTVFS